MAYNIDLIVVPQLIGQNYQFSSYIMQQLNLQNIFEINGLISLDVITKYQKIFRPPTILYSK